MRIQKKPRKHYLYATLGTFAFSIVAFLTTYFMINNYAKNPNIFHYYRGGGIGILVSILFGIVAASGGYCFIKNSQLPYHIDRKISKIITYYAAFVIAMIPILGIIATHKIEGDGYRACESGPYSITYAKNEKACEKYRNRHNFHQND